MHWNVTAPREKKIWENSDRILLWTFNRVLKKEENLNVVKGYEVELQGGAERERRACESTKKERSRVY